MSEAVNKGYLLENFRLFHLRDKRAQRVEPHYHEFDKLVFLISGAVDYSIEGVCYRMQPGDLLFVRHHDIHRPVISPDSVYERIVLWITPDFLERSSLPEEPLWRCFDETAARRRCLCRPGSDAALRLKRIALALEKALQDDAFGSRTMVDAYFRQLLVEAGRCAFSAQPNLPGDVDPKIDEVLRYINLHLAEPLSVERLAAICYLSRYYFMRRFKESTGYSVHGYVQQKRLAAAAELMEEGMSVTDTSLTVGFTDYSSFLRAFHKAYGASPREYLREKKRMDSDYRE